MVRPAETNDLAAILGCYAEARRFMARSGNPTQWGDSYPPPALLREDIAARRLYVCEDESGICGAFALVFGEEPTYAAIEEGAWRDPSPYATIHRVCGGAGRGVFRKCIAYCRERCTHLRIDTHADNLPMQRRIAQSGFVRCGTIHVEDGSPRIAYEWSAQPPKTER